MFDNESIQVIKLSENDEQQAIDTFTTWVNKENIILVVVPGQGPQIDSIIESATSLINDPGNFYKVARVIWAPKPEFIMSKLENLNVASHLSKIDWHNLCEIAALFITGQNNIIAEVIRKPEIDQYIKSRISSGIVQGLGFDNTLYINNDK